MRQIKPTFLEGESVTWKRISKTISLSQKLQQVPFEQVSFINVYKAFIRSHFDYGDVVSDQGNLK